MRGRIPKPTIVKIAEGNLGKRPLNDREPMPRMIAPRCPSYLDERARLEYKKLVKTLSFMKLMSEADGPIVTSLAIALSNLARAQEKLRESGTLLYKSPSNYIMQSPYLSICNTAIEQILKLSRELGMSPCARSRIVIPAEYAEDELDRALFGGILKRAS